MAAAAAISACLSACTTGPETDGGVTRLTPTQSLNCVQFLLDREPVRVVRRDAEDGWRLDVHLLSTPPAGWVDKGTLLHDGRTLAWLPDGATVGIADERVREALAPLLTRCR